MKTSLRQFFALAGSIALLTAPVAPLIAAQSDLEPFDPAAALQGQALQVDEELQAYDMSRIISTQTRLIRYEASEYQRKVAEQRARAFMAAHRKEVANAVAKEKAAKAAPKSTKTSTANKAPKSKPSEPEVTSTPGKKKKKTEIADNRKPESTPTKPEKEAPVEKPSKPVEKPKELPRYIAVDTVKDKRASPKAKKVVMIWDTHAEKLVGNNLYDVENPPRVGQTKVFETYAAEYVGAGL